jgi:hypothetical protein
MTEDEHDGAWSWPYYSSSKCPKDYHKPADTGMRVSYCKKCDTKLIFVDWVWKEAEN